MTFASYYAPEKDTSIFRSLFLPPSSSPNLTGFLLWFFWYHEPLHWRSLWTRGEPPPLTELCFHSWKGGRTERLLTSSLCYIWPCMIDEMEARRMFRERKEHRRGFFFLFLFLFQCLFCSSFIKRPAVGVGMSGEARVSSLCRFLCIFSDVNNLPVVVFWSFISLLFSLSCAFLTLITLFSPVPHSYSLNQSSQPQPQCRLSSYRIGFKRFSNTDTKFSKSLFFFFFPF